LSQQFSKTIFFKKIDGYATPTHPKKIIYFIKNDGLRYHEKLNHPFIRHFKLGKAKFQKTQQNAIFAGQKLLSRQIYLLKTSRNSALALCS
jgi:hypothetical protein